MAITAERFQQGLTYDEFKAGMAKNTERFAHNERHFEPTDSELAVFRALPSPIRVLVLAEDWCGDVIDNLPILGKVAAESGNLDVRIFLRDQNLDLMDDYLKEGKYRSIPVFVFLDEGFKEIGRFIERPASVTARRAGMREVLFAEHPEFGSPDTPLEEMPEIARAGLMQAMAQRRDEWKPDDERAVVQSLREIVERAQA